MNCRRLFTLRERARAALGATAVTAVASLLSGCLDRPVGELPPKTTNVVVDTLAQTTVDKIDMLFVIDNSMSMADKQVVLAEALPNLVERFVNPVCVDADGNTQNAPPSPNDPCPQGYGREFRPITDIHIGVITSSLGGYGSDETCIPPDDVEPWREQMVDMAHLLATRPRASSVAPNATANGGFLKWTEDSNTNDFVPQFEELVVEAGENGCGWEATLEAWYRFLIDPAPYKELRRQSCSGTGTDTNCVGPVLNDDGTIAVDEALLAQRAAFLRPDSLVAIIMLSDENDCSFKAHGQSWLLADTQTEDDYRISYRASEACDQDPDSPCCQSCGASRVAQGCPAAANGKPAGCEDNDGYYSRPGRGDPAPGDMPNLRCYQQKRRFGVDYLYPVERYSNALKAPFICPYSDSLNPDDCGSNETVRNPLYSDLTGGSALPRSDSLVFLAGIVGVPWQDLAVLDEDGDVAEPLRLRVARADAELPEREKLNWNWLLGPDPQATVPQPEDPLMVESVEPRSGTHPVTGEAVAGINAGYMANSINGHEWNIFDKADLQYACIFPKESETCPEQQPAGEQPKNCDCTSTSYGGDEAGNPLCQAQNGDYDRTQRYAKAYPSLRQLQVLNLFGDNSIVASICPKQLDNPNASDYGYNPAVAAIVERLKEQLTDACLPRPLAVDADGTVPCKIVEASPETNKACSEVSAREDVEPAVANVVRKHLRELEKCGGSGGVECDSLRLCYIRALTPDDGDEFVQCLTRESTDANGWCYVDAAHMERYGLNDQQQQQGIGLLENCPETQRRKLRFVGDGTPANGTTTYYTCAGEVL